MDFFKSVTKKATAATSQAMGCVHERVDVCKAGKKLLEDGGDAAMDIMIAKRTARAAIREDQSASANLIQEASMYEDAAAKLRSAMQKPCPDGVTGYDAFEQHAEVYEERAKAFRQAAAALEIGIHDAKASAPSVSPVEEDAMMLAVMKGGEAKLMKGLDSAAEGIKHMSVAASQSCRGGA